MNVQDGHLEAVSAGFRQPPSRAQLVETLASFRSLPQELNLPSAPRRPVVCLEEPDRPQPRLDRYLERGMATVVGRIRACPILDYKFDLLGHNTIRGAAGAAILNAELLRPGNAGRQAVEAAAWTEFLTGSQGSGLIRATLPRLVGNDIEAAKVMYCRLRHSPQKAQVTTETTKSTKVTKRVS